MELEKINCFYLCGIIKEIFKHDINGSYGLVIARDTEKIELILVCYMCQEMFQKIFLLDDNFFDEVKKCFNKILKKVKIGIIFCQLI